MSTGTTNPKTIAFLAFDGITPLDLIGPLQVLANLGPTYRAVVVGKDLRPVVTDTPARIAPDASFADVPHPFAVIVPGGGLPALRVIGDGTTMEYLQTAASTAELVGSVCSGAIVLGAAGLLDGKRATTHWAYTWMLEKFGATYVHHRWVRDGKVVTSAGVSAGIDLGLALAADLTDAATARTIQLGMEYDPEPPFGPIDWTKADRDVLRPGGQGFAFLQQTFADMPDLITRLAS